MASYDLAVGPAGRFMVGMFNEAKGPIGFGTAAFSFFFLGESSASGAPQPGPTATGTYLPLAGSHPPPGDASKPVYLATDQRGVYAADVAFDRPGFWGVSAVIDLDGRQEVKTAFQVLPKHAVPAPGDPAPASQNLTVTTPGAAPEAIDSRASARRPSPTPSSTRPRWPQALAEKRPVGPRDLDPHVLREPVLRAGHRRGGRPGQDLWRPGPLHPHRGVQGLQGAATLNDAAKEWIGSGRGHPRAVGVRDRRRRQGDAPGSTTSPAGGQIEPLLQKLPPMKG